MLEEYDEYGEIKPRKLSYDYTHKIHMTKDIFDSECSLCQLAMKKKIKTYWKDDE